MKPKLRHVVLATSDPDETARFYQEAFELDHVGPCDNELATGHFLSDGTINLAILRFHTDQTGRGADYAGLHHIGFLVPDAEAASATLQDLGADRFMGPENAAGSFFEVKHRGPDEVVIDVADVAWQGAAALDADET